MTRSARHLIAMLALLALAGAQVFGMQRGYLCECTGEPVETPHSHCHVAPSGEAQPCESGAPANHQEQDNHSKPHSPLTVHLAAQAKSASADPPAAPGPAFFHALPWLDILMPMPGSEAVVSHALPHLLGGGPPGVIQVAKCMVLLV